MRHVTRFGWLGSCLAALALGCGSVRSDQETAEPPAPPARAYEPRLQGQSVDRVLLAHPARRPTGPVTEAWLVRLELERPPAWGPVFELYLGDERIEEYGDWSGGLYFKVYEQANLERLAGRPFRYRIGTMSEPAPLGGDLRLPDLASLRAVGERELLR